MALLVLKLVLTPLFIGGASLGARRWGPGFGGWIISLPLTSGPVAFFLALDRGAAFASAAAEASLAGCVAIAAYGVVYARTAERSDWPVALAAGLAGWLVAALAMQPVLHWPVPAVGALVAVGIVVAAQLMPASGSAAAAPTPSRWDVPLRMAVATSVVIVVTAAAPVVGAATSGLLTMLPIMSTILAVFAQRAGGTSHGIAVQRGILSGLLGTAAFLAVVAGSIERVGVAAAFAIALVTVVVIQATVLLMLRARSTAGADGLAGPADAPVRPTLS
ncbi:MAG: hypothetical protein ACHQ15_08870 [Candidatus Limnocylindrales bacterium]